MLCVNIIDNLFLKSTEEVKSSFLNEVTELICENIQQENIDNVYSQQEMTDMISKRTSSALEKRIEKGILIYLTNKNEEVVACGMVVFQDNRYFSKSLNVAKKYRKMGYASIVCEIRENYLREYGIEEVFIESLKYPETIRFHKKRGFFNVAPYKDLKYSILMKKILIEN